MSLTVETVRTPGLGDSTYLLIHNGLAVVVDPQRDIDRFEDVLNRHDAELRFVLETHVHNDYVSGGRDLARRFDAEIVMPAGAAPVFRHRPAFHLEELSVDDLTIRPIHTPGHTPEHTSYLVLIDGHERGVFSGGSLLVGSAGRSDLLGEDRAESLARLQYGSVNRLAELPNHTALYPTHGAGSFCTTTGASSLNSTIGEEKATSPILAYPDEDAFVKGQLSGLVPYPSYYAHMGPANLRINATPDLTAPTLDQVPNEVTVIDGRDRSDVARGHLSGSLGLELSDSFGTWVGWLTDFNAPLALVLDPSQDTGEALRQLTRIGYDDVRGVVRPNPETFTETFRTVEVDEFADAVVDGAQVLDVRAPDEWEGGTIEGATLCYLPDLALEIPAALDARRPVWVTCASGYRATAAATLLQSQGFEPIALIRNGATEVIAATSNPK